MREMLFKELKSANSRKKDTVLREVFEKDGLIAKTERRCFYFVKEVKELMGEEDLQSWLDSQGDSSPSKKRHFHIMKEHKDGSGEDKIVCKIIGTFYAIVGKRVYTVAFLHSFKVSFLKVTLTK